MAKDNKKKASFREYFKGVRTEMKKVVWPTKGARIIYKRCHIDMRRICSWILAHRYRRFSRS